MDPRVSSSGMESAYNKLKKWIPLKPTRVGERNVLLDLYRYFLSVDFTPVTNQYRDRLERIRYKFSASAVASGAVCFFGSVLMSLAQLGYINNMEELFTLSSCYILIDHYLDDSEVSTGEKKKTIQQVKTFIKGVNSPGDDPNPMIDSPIIKVVADRYIGMVSKVPKSEKHLKDLFGAEVKTMWLQKSNKLDRKTYLEICELKGGLTCNAIQALLELEITDQEFRLGACIQLVDDIMDIDDDVELGINTIATYDYREDGNLDRLFLYTLDKIESLERKYNLFKPVLIAGLILGVHTNREKFSPRLLELVEPFNYFHSSTKKETLTEWFQDILLKKD